jgi:N utilization substance protein B
MGNRRKARVLALQIIYQHDIGSRTLDDILRSFWESQGLPPAEVRAFAEDLAAGVRDHLEEIDALTGEYSSHWDLERMAAVDRNILRLAVYELIYRDDIPPKVTINEFVEIAKKFSTEDSGAFVNGVLDRIFKEKSSAKEKD